MRYLFTIVLCVLVARCHANVLDSFKDTFSTIGDNLKPMFHQMVEGGKQIGHSLLNQLQQTAALLASNVLQNLATTLQNSATNRREIGLVDKAVEVFGQFKELMSKKLGQFKTLFHAAMDKLHDLGQKLGSLEPLVQPLQNFLTEVDTTVSTHHNFASYILHELVTEANGILSHVGVKRTAAESFKNFGNSIAQFFQPHIDNLKAVVSAIGDNLKLSASQLVDKLKVHLGKLQDSGNQILQHGKNAIAAIQQAATDILKQTMVNIKPHLQAIVDTGKDAVHTTTNHIINTIVGAGSALTGPGGAGADAGADAGRVVTR